MAPIRVPILVDLGASVRAIPSCYEESCSSITICVSRRGAGNRKMTKQDIAISDPEDPVFD